MELFPSSSTPVNLSKSTHVHSPLLGSGSFQSHLSSTNSMYRLRGATAHSESEKSMLEGKIDVTHPLPTELGNLASVKAFASNLTVQSRPASRMQWVVAAYCCISIVMFSFEMHHNMCNIAATVFSRKINPYVQEELESTMSPLIGISVQERMAIAFPNLSPPGNLDPYILSGRSFAFPVTACLWIEESALDATFSWASQWPGPISLVLVTSVQSDSAEYAQLLKRLHEISGMLSIPSQLSLHVLHVYSPSGSSSNTYLNIARLLSRTVQVILFPGGPPTFQARDDQRIFLVHLNPKTSSSILNNELQKSHSDKAISPVILARNHPVWCTERYFIFGSRMLDWEECLWQLQLESSGDVSVIDAPVEFVASIVNTTSDVSSFAMKYRRRWSSKFRTEACALSSKRSQALDAFNKKVDKKELHWRKKFCRDTLETLAIDAVT